MSEPLPAELSIDLAAVSLGLLQSCPKVCQGLSTIETFTSEEPFHDASLARHEHIVSKHVADVLEPASHRVTQA